MCIYSPMPHTLSYCALIGKCALIRSKTVFVKVKTQQWQLHDNANISYHQSQMLTEKSQPKGKRIMLETRFASFPALSDNPRVGVSRSASETDE